MPRQVSPGLYGPALLCKDVGDRLQNGALACAGNALDGDDPVVGGEQQLARSFLPRVQGHAVFELRERLEPVSGDLCRQDCWCGPAPVFNRGNDALFETDGIAGGDHVAISAFALYQVSLSQQLIDTLFDRGHRGRQSKPECRAINLSARKGGFALTQMPDG